MKKYFDIEIDGQVELENGKTLGELKESSISITDADVSCGGESKNFYILEFDGTDNLYLVKNLTTGEIDEDYGGAVSQQLYEEFQQNPFDVMSRVVTMIGPAGGIGAFYKPIGVVQDVDEPEFVFYAHGSMPMNTTAVWGETWAGYCWH